MERKKQSPKVVSEKQDQQCDTCSVFDSFKTAIANYHKMTLEKQNQMVRNLLSGENINLN